MSNKYSRKAKASRKLRRKQRMCTQKRRYDSEEAAQQKGQQVYHCPHCDGWHRSGKLSELLATVRKKNKKK